MTTDDYRRKFADFLAKQPMTADLTPEQVEGATTRADLGISSLNMVLILVRYIEEYTGNSVTMQPEWVSRLGDVEGILSVLREIDASAAVAPRT
ncbi:hypothetical protein F8R89_26865 [Streptomyces sp. SS1-1]|uniref:hypothetical protein n=1 Tax=Streptomyces sp. SS1-1 TaxID=2651869 RepID=UPI0012506902|nr:hypothetical protein [Streptomyces sp. SS1-1]KAB2975304.1 hypothetical protein F8R89_26865 [Streptomyces sp. SS1-1]